MSDVHVYSFMTAVLSVVWTSVAWTNGVHDPLLVGVVLLFSGPATLAYCIGLVELSLWLESL